MQKIFIIGTIHGNTPFKELEEVLVRLKPNQLLIELPEDALEKFDKNKDMRKEMMYVYRWAKERKIPTYFFDEYQSVFKKGMSVKSPEYKKFMDESEVIVKKYSWKEFNKSEISKKIDILLAKDLFDFKKENMREEKMCVKIKEHMISDGNIVIVTGAGHLDFFKSKFSDAILPLR